MAQTRCSLVNLVVRRTKVCAQFECLRDQIFGTNFVISDVFCASIRDFAY